MEKFKELANEIHDHLNAQGRFNTYIITENLDGKGIYMHTYTHKKEITDEERKSFTQLVKEINPFFARRRKKFTDD